jgi:hypothetical protein
MSNAASAAIRRRLATGQPFAAPRLAVGEQLQSSYAPDRISPSSGVTPGQPYYDAWDSRKAVNEGLRVNVMLATGISRIAEKAADVPWFEWRIEKSGTQTKTEQVNWLGRRDGKIGPKQVMETAHYHSYTSGNALFGVIWEGGQKFRIRPAEVLAEDPYQCAPIPDRVDYISGYEWSDAVGAAYKRWDARDILHVIGRTNPNNPYWGWSIEECLARIIDADVEAQRLMLRRFARNGTPNTIVVVDGNRKPAELRQHQDQLNADAKEIFGGYLVLGGNQKIEKHDIVTEEELGLLKAMAFHRDMIAVALGFHPSMFSSDAATFNNMEIGRELEWQIVAIRNGRFSDVFTNRLIPHRERGERIIAPDYSGVPELQGLQRRIKNCSELVTNCRIAVNDAIRATGLPVPLQQGGDVALVNGALIPASLAAAGIDG